MRTIIKKITDSFPEYTFDMETTMWDWIIYFKSSEIDQLRFFFELSNTTDTEKIIYKVKISNGLKWETIYDDNIDNLIQKTKEILN